MNAIFAQIYDRSLQKIGHVILNMR